MFIENPTDKTPATMLSQVEDSDLLMAPEVERFIKSYLSVALFAPGVPFYNVPADNYLSSFLLILALYELNQMEPVCLNEACYTTGITFNGERVMYPTRDITDPLCAIGLLTYDYIDGSELVYTPCFDPEEMTVDYPPR